MIFDSGCLTIISCDPGLLLAESLLLNCAMLCSPERCICCFLIDDLCIVYAVHFALEQRACSTAKIHGNMTFLRKFDSYQNSVPNLREMYIMVFVFFYIFEHFMRKKTDNITAGGASPYVNPELLMLLQACGIVVVLLNGHCSSFLQANDAKLHSVMERSKNRIVNEMLDSKLLRKETRAATGDCDEDEDGIVLYGDEDEDAGGRNILSANEVLVVVESEAFVEHVTRALLADSLRSVSLTSRGPRGLLISLKKYIAGAKYRHECMPEVTQRLLEEYFDLFNVKMPPQSPIRVDASRDAPMNMYVDPKVVRAVNKTLVSEAAGTKVVVKPIDRQLQARDKLLAVIDASKPKEADAANALAELQLAQADDGKAKKRPPPVHWVDKLENTRRRTKASQAVLSEDPAKKKKTRAGAAPTKVAGTKAPKAFAKRTIITKVGSVAEAMLDVEYPEDCIAVDDVFSVVDDDDDGQ